MLRRMPSVLLATAIMLVSVALAVVVLLLSNLYDGGAPVAAQTSPAKPNFVFILTDDMRGSVPWNRGQAASSASSSHFGFRPRHLGSSAGGTANVNNSSIDQR